MNQTLKFLLKTLQWLSSALRLLPNSLAEALCDVDPASTVPHSARPHSAHSSRSAWGLNALSLVFFRASAFSPQLTLTSCFKMSDSLVLCGPHFLRQPGSDHPFQDSPLPGHCPPSLPVGRMLLVCLHHWNIKSMGGETLPVLLSHPGI